MAIININSPETEGFNAFQKDFDAFAEESRYLEERGSRAKLTDDIEYLDLISAEETIAALQGGVDWDEAKQVGLHLPSGNVVRPSGDGYYNPHGNGARHISTLGAMILSGPES